MLLVIITPGGGAMDKKVTPNRIMSGDIVSINGHRYMVKDINGPDYIGTYDIYVRDQQGQDHIEIVTEAITLHL